MELRRRRVLAGRRARGRRSRRSPSSGGSVLLPALTIRCSAGASMSGSIAVQTSRVMPPFIADVADGLAADQAADRALARFAGGVVALARVERRDVVAALASRPAPRPRLSVEPVWAASYFGRDRRRRLDVADRVGADVRRLAGREAELGRRAGRTRRRPRRRTARRCRRGRCSRRSAGGCAARAPAARAAPASPAIARRARVPRKNSCPTLPSTNAAQQNIAIANGLLRDARASSSTTQRQQRRTRSARGSCAARWRASRGARRSPARCRSAARGSAPAAPCSGRTRAARRTLPAR